MSVTSSRRSLSPVKREMKGIKNVNKKVTRDELEKTEQCEIKDHEKLQYSDFNKVVLDF